MPVSPPWRLSGTESRPGAGPAADGRKGVCVCARVSDIVSYVVPFAVSCRGVSVSVLRVCVCVFVCGFLGLETITR